MPEDVIVGIDLGTTNSEVAAYLDGTVQVLSRGGKQILPSCVGLSPTGELLVGEIARNQQLVYPERTIRSIKRKMGSDEKVPLGDQMLSPQEVSSLILKELVSWAQAQLKAEVHKAVITVPAYFSDAQRQATREAGALAGLEIVRIINEPTAAGLAYGYGKGQEAARSVLVYDLGGGTFDVSVLNMEGDITEVLASHGNNHLGGDDFDQLLARHLAKEFQEKHGVEIEESNRLAWSRLWWAAEEAKIKLSSSPYARVREEALLVKDGKPLHLNVEVSREQFEAMIRPLVESTLDSVSKALDGAGKHPNDMDAILLVGGSTRIPLVSELLEERTGLAPHQEVHPELCVALGAGVLASRIAGHEVEQALVDVTPYSFGPSYLGTRGGYPYPHCYKPIIHRNTSLPVTRTERYYTVQPYQTSVIIDIYQGDDPDALRDILVGSFKVEGLRPIAEPNEVLCRMSLDLDGILRVSAIEKATGKIKEIKITNALAQMSEEQIAEARKRMEELYGTREPIAEAEIVSEGEAPEELEASPWHETSGVEREEVEEQGAIEEERVNEEEAQSAETGLAAAQAAQLLERSRALLDTMHEQDKEEAIELNTSVEEALRADDQAALHESMEKLRELLFFVEGRP